MKRLFILKIFLMLQNMGRKKEKKVYKSEYKLRYTNRTKICPLINTFSYVE